MEIGMYLQRVIRHHMKNVAHVNDVHEGHMYEMDEHVHHMINVVQLKYHQHVMMEAGIRHHEIIHHQICDVQNDVMRYECAQLQRMDEHVKHMLHVVQHLKQ